MKHLNNFEKYNESVESPYIRVNSTNYKECVEKIPKQLDKDGKVSLQVYVGKDDNGQSTYDKLLDRLGLEEVSGMTRTEDGSPWYIVEVTFK